MKLKKQLALLLTSVLLVGILAACGTSEKKILTQLIIKTKKF